MKLGVVIDELISGGFQKVAIMEVKHLKKMGHDVSLVVLHRREIEGYEDLIKQNNISVIYLSDRLPFYLKVNFHFPFFAFFSFFHIFYPLFIHHYVRQEEFDVLIPHGTYTAFSTITLSNKLGIPYICFVHDSISYILKQKYKDKLLGRFLGVLLPIAQILDKIIVQNAESILTFPEMIQEMRELTPNYENFHELQNGCEAIEDAKINYSKKDYAISVTKWDQGKNFAFLVDLWSKLPHKTTLKIIGSFSPLDLERSYKRLIQNAGLSDHIEIIGRVSEKKLSDYYKNARFLIHPCREAFGMTILESSAQGCPSIFTKNSGVASLYTLTLQGQLPEENNLSDYTRLVEYVMGLSNSDYETLVREYHKAAKENSWENHCKIILANCRVHS